MSDTTTPPEPAVEPETPEENQGKSRMWLFFITGLIFLLLIIYIGSRTETPPPPVQAAPATPAVR